jgi:hypothetical protein
MQYRLVQVDVDGKFEIFRPVVLYRNVDAEKLVPSPMPFADELRLSFVAEEEGISRAVITDITGKEVSKAVVNAMVGQNTISFKDLNSLPKGIYQVVVTTPARSITQRIVKD